MVAALDLCRVKLFDKPLVKAKLQLVERLAGLQESVSAPGAGAAGWCEQGSSLGKSIVHCYSLVPKLPLAAEHTIEKSLTLALGAG